MKDLVLDRVFNVFSKTYTISLRKLHPQNKCVYCRLADTDYEVAEALGAEWNMFKKIARESGAMYKNIITLHLKVIMI